MTIISYFLLPLLSLLLSLFDTSFFSFHEIFGSTIISSFGILLVVTLLGHRRAALVLGSSSVLFLSAFSSLPVYMLLLAFMGIPLLIFYLKNKIFFESSLFMVIVIIFLSSLAFRLAIIPVSGGSEQVMQSIIFFPVLNTLFSLICYVLIKKILTYFA